MRGGVGGGAHAVINGTWASFREKLSGPPYRPPNLRGAAGRTLIDQELMRRVVDRLAVAEPGRPRHRWADRDRRRRCTMARRVRARPRPAVRVRLERQRTAFLAGGEAGAADAWRSPTTMGASHWRRSALWPRLPHPRASPLAAAAGAAGAGATSCGCRPRRAVGRWAPRPRGGDARRDALCLLDGAQAQARVWRVRVGPQRESPHPPTPAPAGSGQKSILFGHTFFGQLATSRSVRAAERSELRVRLLRGCPCKVAGPPRPRAPTAYVCRHRGSECVRPPLPPGEL